MNGFFGPDDPADPDLERFAEDLRSAFPSAPVPPQAADEHIVAMMAAVDLLAEEASSPREPASPDRGAARRHPTPRRSTMRRRLAMRIAAVATGLLLTFGGLALAGAFPGSDDDADDTTAVVSDLPEQDDLDADDQGEDADDEGEDADDQGEDADDQGEDADDQGEDADDQGEDADDQGEDADDQGEDADDDTDDQAEDQGDDEGDEDDGDQDAGGDSDS